MKALLQKLRAHLVATTPEVDLDAPGFRTARTEEGVVVDIDPVAYRRAMRRAGVVVGIFFAFFLPFPITGLRVVGAVGIVAAFALAFLGKPRADRLIVGPRGVAARVKGRPPRDAAAEDVACVRLEREEHEVHDSDGSHRRVVWPVRVVVGDATWYLARSADRAKARAFAEDAAIALGRPFVDATGGEVTVVPADAVNLPFADRVRAGVAVAEEPGTPPAGIERRSTPQGVEFVAPRRAWRRAGALAFVGGWFVLLGGGGVVLLVAAALQEGAAWALAFALFPLLFALAGVLFVAGAVGSVTGESYVRVERDALVHGVRRRGRDKARRTGFDAFEDVRGARGVRLVSDADDVEIGFDLLPDAAQAWLAAALKAEIARR